MAEVINLKRARKDKARSDREQQAAANRRRFGRTKAEKTADRDAEQRGVRTIDGKRLDRDPPSRA
jgi:hypothetical protein